MKIISLVPSITETLIDFGLNENQIIGRTKFCIHPKSIVEKIEIIGGTKNLNIEKIKSLKPDLIIANKEENTKESIEELAKNFKVWVTQIQNIEDNYYFLKKLGQILHQEERAQLFNLKTYEVLQENTLTKPLKTAYLIWQKPYMTVGRDTFINDILQNLGFENIFNHKNRYPIIEIDDLKDAEIIMLSSEPFPFKENHIEELKKIYPDKSIILVDGEAFSWFGSRMAKSGNYFKNLIHKIDNP